MAIRISMTCCVNPETIRLTVHKNGFLSQRLIKRLEARRKLPNNHTVGLPCDSPTKCCIVATGENYQDYRFFGVFVNLDIEGR